MSFPGCITQSFMLNYVRAGKRVMALLICALCPVFAGAQQSGEPEQFLTKYLGFSHDQVLQVQQGAAIVKILKPEKHEVAVAAVVRLNVPQEFFVARFRDIERHKKSEAVLQVRKLSTPAQPDDFGGLALLPQEIKALESCEPGECQIKLCRRQIDLIHQRLGFAATDTGDQANTVMRSMLADYAREYSAGGNRAMVVYDDKGYAAASETQFSELLDRSSYLRDYAPEFYDYLRNFPDTALKGVDRFLYWSKENYGHALQPVTAITDAVIYVRAPGKNPSVLFASKQIYATHYFEASLGLTMLFASSATDPFPSFYLVYVNRSRIDLLRKWYSIFARGRISDSVASSMRKGVLEVKSKVEAEYSAAQAAVQAAAAQPHNSKRGLNH